MLKEGMQAPEFTLADKDGKSVSLSDFLGKKSSSLLLPQRQYARMYASGVCLCNVIQRI